MGCENSIFPIGEEIFDDFNEITQSFAVENHKY
jgi:hypothetical protein